MMSVQMAKSVMKMWEAVPRAPDNGVGELQEVFRHRTFLEGSPERRKAIMLESSRSKYESELAYPWDHYFGQDLAPLLRGQEALDLGCFTGGRSVAWFERYQLRFVQGIDVEDEYIEAATQFAALKNVPSQYQVARGEQLPYATESLDAVLSFDVFEHVQDVGRTLEECRRILKPGGRLFVVFPSYFHPTEHHLALVTKMPGIHYLFSGKTLVRAYYEILEERGEAAYWYKRKSPQLQPWERGNTINGTTLAKFRRMLRNGGWKILLHSTKPIGSIGRNATRMRSAALLTPAFGVAARMPGLRELFLHRITYILEKEQGRSS
jgi:2-polyprenyl-3-methyl-5-hydroxy-6-metoxy-1,4-benzoquinol methylase